VRWCGRSPRRAPRPRRWSGVSPARIERGLAALLDARGLDDVRTTQDQNLVVRNVPAADVDAIVAGVRALGLDLPRPGDNVVACPGTTTCRLGITSSQGLAARLAGIAGDLRIRVSGCHNGCAQPETGEIGIYGEGRRMHDRLVPHYQMYLGGDGTAGGRLARKGPSVPVARIERALARIGEAWKSGRAQHERFFDWVHAQADDYFDRLLADLVAVAPDELDAVLRDVDGAADFTVAQLGGGECAGVAQVFIGAAFFAAAHERRYRDAFAAQRRGADARACAVAQLRLIGQGLIDLVDPAPSFRVRKLRTDLGDIAEALAGKAPDDLTLAFADFARILGTEDEASLDASVFAAIDRWVGEAAAFCVERDTLLDLTGALPVMAAPAPIRFVARERSVA
jgi:sulfite reductase (NADPH) hemoprotein beta-component